MRPIRVWIAGMLVGCGLQAGAQQHTLPLWPKGNPEPSTISGPEKDPTTDANRIVSGKVTVRVTNVTKPTVAVFRLQRERIPGQRPSCFREGPTSGWLTTLKARRCATG